MVLDNNYFISSTSFSAPPLAGGLYIVATPIGNLRDISLRALETLCAADLILCEDTRTSAKLLDHYGIKTSRSPLHEHNEKGQIMSVLKRLEEGQSIALISDAGTPLISDPGFPLVRAVRDKGYDIFALPGASALLAALTIAGLPTNSFSYFGFLPSKSGARKSELDAIKIRSETLVFYESPRRLAATIDAMAEIFGNDRKAVIALELTKKFERTMNGTLADLGEQLADKKIKGEAVIIVGGAEEVPIEKDQWMGALEKALEQNPLRTAVDEISQSFNIKRKQVYDGALELKKKKG